MTKNKYTVLIRSWLVAIFLLIQFVSVAQTCPDGPESSTTIVATPEQCVGSNDGQIQINFVDASGNYDASLGDFTPGTGDYEYNLFDSGDGWVYSESGFTAFNTPGISVSFTAPNTITFTGLPPITDGSGYAIYLSGGTCAIPAQEYTSGPFNIMVAAAVPIVIDDASITTVGNTKCIAPFDGSINATGTVTGGAGSYEYSIDGITFQPSPVFANLEHNPYTLSVRDANGCIQTESITVPDNRVNPTAAITPDPAQVCVNANLVLDGNPGGGSGTFTTHSWTGDIAPLSDPSIQAPTFNSATVGTFNLTYTVTDDNGCTATDNITVTVVDEPDLSLTVSPQVATICENTGTNILVDNSEVGYNYTLRDAANNIISGPTAGTSGQISFPTGNLTVTTTFNVLVSNGVCADQQLTNTAEVTVVPGPDITLPVSPETATICEATSTNIFVDNSENGFDYQLREGVTPVGAIVVGNGGQISLPTGNISTTTTFNVTVNNGTCPPQQLDNTATVNVVSNPDLTLTVTAASPEVCPGTGTNILVDGTEAGYFYQLRNDAGDVIITTPAEPGTGGQISLPTGNLTVATTFNVLVTNGICADQELATLVTVDMHTPPTSATLSGDATICAGNSTDLSVAIVDGTAPYSFTLSDGTAVTSYNSGFPINVTPVATTTYTIAGNVTDANGCTVAGSGSATVTVEPSPDISLGVSAQDPVICENTGTNIIVASSEAGVSYQLRNDFDDSLIGASVLSAGGDLNLPTGNLTGDITFNVVADNGSCPPVELTQTASVTVASDPDISLTVEMQDSEVCEGSSTNVIVRNSQLGYDYQLRNDADDSAIGAVVAGTGSDINLPTDPLTVDMTFNVLVSNGVCADAQLTQTPAVTVNQPPTLAELSGDSDLCNGSTTDLVVTITGGTAPYNFTLSDGTVETNYNSGTPIPVNPTTTTTYTIVGNVEDSKGCVVAGSGSATVTVNEPPTLAELSGDNTICEGETTDLVVTITNGTGPYTIEVDNGIGVINNYASGSAIPTPALATSTTYNMVGNVIDANGCTVAGSGTATITVVPPPVLTLAVTPQDATICSGTTTDILVDGSENGFIYQLRNAATDVAIGAAVIGSGGQISLPTGNLTTTTDFKATVTNTTCPEAELVNTAQVVVEPSPDISLGVSAQDPVICENTGTNIIVASSEAGVSYQLRNDFDDSLIGASVLSAGGDLNLPTGNLTGDITFNVVANNGSCPPVELTQTASVTVASDPDISLTVEMQDSEVCEGSSTNVIVRSSQLGYDYQLRNDADDSAIGTVVAGTGSDINLPTDPLTVDMTFNVLVSNGVCADAQLTQTPAVTVNQGPTATSISDDGDICAGEDAFLRVTITDGTGPYTITINNGIGTNIGYNSGDAILVNPTATTTYNLIGNVVDANGCSVAASGSTEIVVNSVTADAGADQTIAFSNTTTLSASGTSGGSGGYDFAWEPAALLVNPTAENPLTQSLTVTTDFTLTVTDAITGCTDTDVVRVNVTGGPLTATISATPNAICVGETSQLEVVPSGGSGTYDITWDNAGLLDDNTSATPIATPTVTTTFEVTIDDGAGQTVTESVLVTVNPLPTVDTEPTDQTVCISQDATFTVAATGSGLTYQWQEDTGGGFTSLVGETNASLTVAGATLAQSGHQYQVVVTSDQGCEVTSAVATLNVSNPQITTQPTDQTICDGQDATFTAVATGSGLTYQWQEDTGGGFADLLGETNPSLTVAGAALAQSGHQYQVIVTDVNGCSVTSNVATLTVTTTPDATFTYNASDYCPTGTVSPNTLPPTPGGTYTASGVLIIDPATGEIDLTSGTPGTTYSITYQVGNATCSDNHTEFLAISDPGDAGFNYGGVTTFCQTDVDPTATITGDAGGEFTANLPNLAIVLNEAGAGTIDLSDSDPGTYNVIYTPPGTCGVNSTISVTITAAAASNVSYAAAAYCIGSGLQSPDDPVAPNGTFTSSDPALDIDAVSGAIDTDNSAAGDYTITYTPNDACTNPSTFNVAIQVIPTANAGADGSSCTLSYQLNGNTPVAGTGAWTTLGQPGGSTVSFDDPTSPTTSVTVDVVGTYEFQWEVSNGVCTPASDAVEINFADPLVVTDVAADYQDSFCSGFGGFGVGSYKVSASGGSGVYTYEWFGNDWNGNSINESDDFLNGADGDGVFGTGVAGGIYTLTVTDDNNPGCDTTIVAVIGNADLDPLLVVNTTASCDGSATGDIES